MLFTLMFVHTIKLFSVQHTTIECCVLICCCTTLHTLIGLYMPTLHTLDAFSYIIMFVMMIDWFSCFVNMHITYFIIELVHEPTLYTYYNASTPFTHVFNSHCLTHTPCCILVHTYNTHTCSTPLHFFIMTHTNYHLTTMSLYAHPYYTKQPNHTNILVLWVFMFMQYWSTCDQLMSSNTISIH